MSGRNIWHVHGPGRFMQMSRRSSSWMRVVVWWMCQRHRRGFTSKKRGELWLPKGLTEALPAPAPSRAKQRNPVTSRCSGAPPRGLQKQIFIHVSKTKSEQTFSVASHAAMEGPATPSQGTPAAQTALTDEEARKAAVLIQVRRPCPPKH